MRIIIETAGWVASFSLHDNEQTESFVNSNTWLRKIVNRFGFATQIFMAVTHVHVQDALLFKTYPNVNSHFSVGGEDVAVRLTVPHEQWHVDLCV